MSGPTPRGVCVAMHNGQHSIYFAASSFQRDVWGTRTPIYICHFQVHCGNYSLPFATGRLLTRGRLVCLSRNTQSTHCFRKSFAKGRVSALFCVRRRKKHEFLNRVLCTKFPVPSADSSSQLQILVSRSLKLSRTGTQKSIPSPH